MTTDQEPRSFTDLAEHARDVQTEAAALSDHRGGGPVAAEAVAWQVERLAAQFAEACERLAGQ